MTITHPELIVLVPLISAFFTALYTIPFLFQATVAAIVIPIAIRYDRYYNYVYEHSEALKNLQEINRHYVFIGVNNLNVRKTYDNDYYFQRVSPKDYLIYRLRTMNSDVLLAVSNATDNRINYEKYSKEVSEKCKYGMIPIDTGHLRRDVLLKYERTEFERLLHRPVTHFTMTSTIVRVSNDDYYMYSKSETFDTKTIVDLLEKLEERNGEFFSDDEVWHSICHVEEAKITNRVKSLVFNKDYNRCCRCGSKRDLTVVHIFPISKGGKTSYSNLQTLCTKCAKRKGDRIIRYQIYE